jgi:hypothetical protein
MAPQMSRNDDGLPTPLATELDRALRRATDRTISDQRSPSLSSIALPANPGFVVLDNITVNSTVFTGPADNGGN